MAKLWNGVAILLLVLGFLWAIVVNHTGIIAYRAGDIGGAGASVMLRLVPFLLAARWARNVAIERRTGWVLKVILALWIIAWIGQIGATSG